MTQTVQRDTQSCGLDSPTGGPTNALQMESSVTRSAKKHRGAQVEFCSHPHPVVHHSRVLSSRWVKLHFLSSDGFFVCGLNLTADRNYILDNWKVSLKKLTFNNWQDLRTWVEQQSPGSGPQCLNIVAGDFVGSLPLCSLVVALNRKLLPQNRKNEHAT